MKPLHVVTLAIIVGLLEAAWATEVYWVPAHDLAPGGELNAPAASDLDGDGDLDIANLPLSTVGGINGHIWWNIGTPQAPAWQIDANGFPGLPPCGERRGCLGDVDLDGDNDLVLGCSDGGLRLVWNVGTPQAAEWQYAGAPFASIWPSICAWPHFGDYDADGDLDMSITHMGAGTHYVENAGSPADPEWVLQGSLGWGIIPADSRPCMAPGDLDGDGDLDLVGQGRGHGVCAWENVGTPEDFQYTLNPSLLLGVEEPQEGSAGVELLDVDADGDLDLLIGGHWGEANYLYLNERFTPAEPKSWGAIKAIYR